MTGCVFCDTDEIQWAVLRVSDTDTHRERTVSVCINHYATLFHDS